ncbi:MAG TPA: lamin tail domain-containing protein [Kofleriaceae bacterium]|nr:lamin tail domain-containing protein [Kofleriaceae bacterium]
MKPLAVFLGAVTAAGCASSRVPGGFDDEVDAAATDAGDPADDAAGADGARPDASTPDAPAATGAATLLLSEVVLAPNEQELIEIVNYGPAAVDLSTYYLSDAREYWRLPADVPTVDTADFIVRFPAGATIPPRGVVTVAIDTAAAFTTALGTAPTYSIASGTMVVVTSGGVATLTNAGEPIVLFQWDGQGDRVLDVDLVLAGVPSAANLLADKSGVALDGPDAGAATSAYATDARTIAPQAAAPPSGRSTKRIALESAAVEVATGGNGALGHDETTEATGTTWDTTFTAPTPGAVPAALTP